MDLKKIESQIQDKEKSLTIIQKDILDKGKELSERQAIYSRSILSHADSQKKPASLEVQRDRVQKAQIEADGLIGVQSLVEGELVDLRKELELCQLYENEGKRFNKSFSTCGEITEKMKGLGKELSENIARYNLAVGELFKAVEQGISSFSTVHGAVPRNYSLTSFLDGELSEIEGGEDHDSTLIKAGGELQALALSPKFDIEVVEEFLTQVQALNQWQMTVAKKSEAGLITSRYALQKPKPKVIPVDGETARTHRILQERAQKIDERKRARLEILRGQNPQKAPVRTVGQAVR